MESAAGSISNFRYPLRCKFPRRLRAAARRTKRPQHKQQRSSEAAATPRASAGQLKTRQSCAHKRRKNKDSLEAKPRGVISKPFSAPGAFAYAASAPHHGLARVSPHLSIASRSDPCSGGRSKLHRMPAAPSWTTFSARYTNFFQRDVVRTMFWKLTRSIAEPCSPS